MRLRIRRFWRRRDADDWAPAPRGQRLLVAGAAVAITLAIGLALVTPHLEFMRGKRAADVLKPCAPGQTRDCVGGAMGVVIVAPPASAGR